MSELELPELTAQSLARIRERTPLIHNITNFVVMNDTANVLLALGASPVMAHAIEEVREMVSYAGALVLNIGTLDDRWVEAMLAAGDEANARCVPVVLDPVGVGATTFRTTTVERIRSRVRVAVVRGNAAELAAIGGLEAKIRGVDSVASGDPAAAARLAAAGFGGVAIVSGPVDYVSDGSRVVEVHNGHPLMGRITGSGCMATATVGAFLAVEPDPFLAAVEATIAFGIAGEMAAESSAGPGSFRVQLMDAIAALDEATILVRARTTIRDAQPA